MQAILSFLPRDFYINVDYLCYMGKLNVTEFNYYLKIINNVESKILSVKNLLEIIDNNNKIIIDEYYENYEEIENNLFNLLFNNYSDSSKLKNILNQFYIEYNKFFNDNIYVSDDNIIINLEREITDKDFINQILSKNVKLNMNLVNNNLLNSIVASFLLYCDTSSGNKKRLEDYGNFKLKKLFKILGSYFYKILKPDININDSFSLNFAKFNKFLIFDMIDRVGYLELKEIILLIYILCIDNDKKGNLFDVILNKLRDKETIIVQRIKLNGRING